MIDEKLIEQIWEMRAQGCTPKQIGRALGLARADVAAVLRDPAAPKGNPDVRCWVNTGWRTGLRVRGHEDWPSGRDADTAEGGLVAVLIARRHRYDKVSVCGYLVDVYCLGVKDALGPRIMDQRDLVAFRGHYFGMFPGGSVCAPLECAQQLVSGGVEYARRLGFEPHADFATAAGHLGSTDGRCDIEFGLNGTPFYVQGPYDDARYVINRLDRTVGRDGYHFIRTVELVDAEF